MAQRVGFSANEDKGIKSFDILEGSHLSYIGNGTVAITVKNIKTNEILDFKITYSYDESKASSLIAAESKKR